MANIPDDLKYSKDHEWVQPTGNGRVRVGITDHAQKQLGDIVYIELPKAGDTFGAFEPFGSVESVKAVTEVYTPLTGSIANVNANLNDSPETVNGDPYGEGWMVEITMAQAGELKELLTAAQYNDYISEEASG